MRSLRILENVELGANSYLFAPVVAQLIVYIAGEINNK